MIFTERGIIKRSSPSEKHPYNRYKNILACDFFHRCAYCDLPDDESLLIPFEIDHFIPKKTFEGIKDYLKDDYKNLVYSCKKCNRSKSFFFKGDIYSDYPTNEYFFEPESFDFNSVFYRDKYGVICSNDPKGQSVIKMLNLKRLLYSIGWIVSYFRKYVMRFEAFAFACKELKQDRKAEEITDLIGKLKSKLYDLQCIFAAYYKSSSEEI